MNADWRPLRELLTPVTDQITLPWNDIDRLVGGLPRSAYDHPAFWSGDRSQWRGFRATNVRVGDAVLFIRNTSATAEPPSIVNRAPSSTVPAQPDVVLIGCSKSKLDYPAPAQDLYTSALFAKRKAYATATGKPWFILSAQHGLLKPTTQIAPYDLNLGDTPQSFRSSWGTRVAESLRAAHGSLDNVVVEIHAGSTYTNAVRKPLHSLGARVEEPMRGLRQGEQSAWYRPLGAAPGDQPDRQQAAVELARRLMNRSASMTPADFLATPGLAAPGLYSWWVDDSGASELADGLGLHVAPGLIYAGLAGATRTVSGRKSSNTLRGRIAGMHLAGNRNFSTFRLTLTAILSASSAELLDEASLTAWMHHHLRVVPVPVDDPDCLDAMETAVLTDIDPPLNLAKMPSTPVRRRLKVLRSAVKGAGAGAERRSSELDT